MDSRMETFLVLCKTMNYRKTAELLHLSQPAVTKQIQSLEGEFGVEFFIYDGRKLSRTRESFLLEEYGISQQYNYCDLRKRLGERKEKTLRIGATKTIGEFIIGKRVEKYLAKREHNVCLLVDNTKTLLEGLEHQKLDFALVEGYFDKKKYGHCFFAREPFLGICRKDHPFAGKKVSLCELWKENLIIREEGSGTRQIFQQELMSMGYALEYFQKVTTISSFSVIGELVKAGLGITFAYESVATAMDGLTTFIMENNQISHEFFFVYLQNTRAEKYVEHFMAESALEKIKEEEQQ